MRQLSSSSSSDVTARPARCSVGAVRFPRSGTPSAPAEPADDSTRSTSGKQTAETTRSAALEIARAAPAAVPGTQSASIFQLRGRGRMLAEVGTDCRTAVLGTCQTGSGRGPGLEALHLQRPVLIDDMATATRWPEFRTAAVDLGIGGVLCLPLSIAGHHIGVLSLYAGAGHRFTRDEQTLAAVLARRAARTLSEGTSEPGGPHADHGHRHVRRTDRSSAGGIRVQRQWRRIRRAQ